MCRNANSSPCFGVFRPMRGCGHLPYPLRRLTGWSAVTINDVGNSLPMPGNKRARTANDFGAITGQSKPQPISPRLPQHIARASQRRLADCGWAEQYDSFGKLRQHDAREGIWSSLGAANWRAGRVPGSCDAIASGGGIFGSRWCSGRARISHEPSLRRRSILTL